ncbi:MAG: hypothetical protein ACRDI2_07885 [Chloroflexota bacterium]
MSEALGEDTAGKRIAVDDDLAPEPPEGGNSDYGVEIVFHRPRIGGDAKPEARIGGRWLQAWLRCARTVHSRP